MIGEDSESMIIPMYFDWEILNLGYKVPVNWDVRKFPHSLILGITNSGKTYALKILLCNIVKFAKNPIVYVCDYKLQDFKFLSGAKNFFPFTQVGEGIEAFYQIFLNRLQEIDCTKNYHFLVIDEWTAFLNSCDKKTSDHYKSILATLAMAGRSFNMIVICCQQRADSEQFAKSRENYSIQIIMGNMSKESAGMFSLDRNAMKNCYRPGQGHVLFSDGRLVPIVVPRIKNMEILNDTIRLAVNRS